MQKFPRRTFLQSAAAGTVAIALAEDVSAMQTADAKNSSGLKAVTFKVDVTPPVGATLAYVPNENIETPIYVSGIVLDDGKTRAVWVSCDYLYICGESYNVWTETIAKSADALPENVFHHSVHQHDSIRWAPEYNPQEGEDGPVIVEPEYCEKSLKDVSEAIAKAVAGPWQSVGKLLTSETRVGGLAANRRLVDENGQFAHTRYSGRNSPTVQAWSVGKIDPILRTVCFENTEGQKIVALHFYATHPMAAYRRKMVSTDVPGRALRHVVENDDSVALNIYVSGCGGDVTFGKYNPSGIEGIELLGKRLGEAILHNLKHLEEQPLGPIDVKRVVVEIPFNPSISPHTEYTGGHASERRYLLKTLDRWRQSTVARMSLGPRVHFLSFAFGEIFVDYQLYAQSLIPEHFLATAAFGNGVYWYIPTKEAFQENGGYETSDLACVVTPEIDGFLREALRKCFAEIVSSNPF